jgi:EAL domain-containing protein (putative c-di-GMP-specific phosphodiesterase class I)
MRRHDRFMAYGPGRFALALASCEAADAESAVTRLLARFEDTRLAGGLRLGAASAPDHAVDAPQLLRRAEEALAMAARRGGPFAIYRAVAPAAPASPCGTSAYDIVDALNARSLIFALQPVQDARTRSLVFSEALPRLLVRERLLAAGDIRPAAEREGLAALVDARMLELVADHLAGRPDERVALAVSPATLADTEWLTQLAAHLGARPGIESRLVVQIPESAIAHARGIRGRLDAMKALGVATALTGFGAGHVSFKDLRGLPVDMLRIDGTFVETLSRSTDDRLFVRTLVGLTHHLGIAVAAEWVDDAETARLLTEWGVDYLQGTGIGAIAPAMSLAGTTQRLAGAAR